MEEDSQWMLDILIRLILFPLDGDYHELTVGKDFFVFCHYPFVEWNRQRHGAYHLHGHQHNHSDYNLRQRKEGLRRYDVGVDANGFTPVPLEKIVRIFAESA